MKETKAFCGPLAMWENFSWPILVSLAVSRRIARKSNDNQPFLVQKKLPCQRNHLKFSLKQSVINSVMVQYSYFVKILNCPKSSTSI